jgi:outer membrane protein OmpA-like peptidoglycan-associated protein
MVPVVHHNTGEHMKHLLIFAAFTASAANAQSFVSAAGEAVRSGSGEPWQVASWQAPMRRALSAEVLFDFDGNELRGEGRKVLDDLAQRLTAAGAIERVTATAHADRLGHATYNLGLSARRAYAVRDYLVEKGVPAAAIRIDVAGAAAGSAVCDDLGEETGRNVKLVACLQPDRRVAIEAR